MNQLQSSSALHAFRVNVRSAKNSTNFVALGHSSADVLLAAIQLFGVCGVSVTPIKGAA